MKVIRVTVAGSVALLLSFAFCAVAQDPAADNLPGAPSSVKQQAQEKAQPASPPVPSPAQTPAASSNTPASVPDNAAKTGNGTSNPDASSGTVETTTTIRVPVNEVNVVFTVTDKHGRYVKDLKR